MSGPIEVICTELVNNVVGSPNSCTGELEYGTGYHYSELAICPKPSDPRF
jgi:hypothetical protein